MNVWIGTPEEDIAAQEEAKRQRTFFQWEPETPVKVEHPPEQVPSYLE